MVSWIEVTTVAFAALVCVGSCVQQGIEDDLVLPELDEPYFRCAVEPVLVKRCAFVACHGSDDRPFRVYAQHRLRLNASSGASLTTEEHRANYDKSLGFAGGDGAPRLLLLKALSASAGGYFHRGEQLYGGGDVFESADDPGYQTLAAWTEGGGQAAPDCTPVPEIGP